MHSRCNNKDVTIIDEYIASRLPFGCRRRDMIKPLTTLTVAHNDATSLTTTNPQLHNISSQT